MLEQTWTDSGMFKLYPYSQAQTCQIISVPLGTQNVKCLFTINAISSDCFLQWISMDYSSIHSQYWNFTLNDIVWTVQISKISLQDQVPLLNTFLRIYMTSDPFTYTENTVHNNEHFCMFISNYDYVTVWHYGIVKYATWSWNSSFTPNGHVWIDWSLDCLRMNLFCHHWKVDVLEYDPNASKLFPYKYSWL